MSDFERKIDFLLTDPDPHLRNYRDAIIDVCDTAEIVLAWFKENIPESTPDPVAVAMMTGKIVEVATTATRP